VTTPEVVVVESASAEVLEVEALYGIGGDSLKRRDT